MLKSNIAVYVLVTASCLAVASVQPGDAVVENLGAAAGRFAPQPEQPRIHARASDRDLRATPVAFRSTGQ
ncbi:MAG TPA: hypothetical protein VF319_12865 [Caldimonas sp.]